MDRDLNNEVSSSSAIHSKKLLKYFTFLIILSMFFFLLANIYYILTLRKVSNKINFNNSAIHHKYKSHFSTFSQTSKSDLGREINMLDEVMENPAISDKNTSIVSINEIHSTIATINDPLGKLTVTREKPFYKQKTALKAVDTSCLNINRLHGKFEDLMPPDVVWIKDPYTITSLTGNENKKYGFNYLLSNSISLNRPVNDYRSEKCRKTMYNLENIPPVSVILIFYEEPFSTLLRSIHSILNRTPPNILGEIILVDDGNNDPDVYSNDEKKPSKLQRYVQYLPKTRLIRSSQRQGIVKARLLGISHARFDIFVILDSHIEVQPQWLEPLATRIHENPKTFVMPIIDGIDTKTFDFRKSSSMCTMGIIWFLMEHSFTRIYRDPENNPELRSDYRFSPTMPGGLFAANKKYFYDIGSYDDGMTYWGVENLELSFRIWLCGGTLECSQCSRVYHIYREGRTSSSVPDPSSYLRNKLRLMHVWMDEFADVTWRIIGEPKISYGNISSRIELRKKLGCKPFKYFLDNIWPESPIHNLPEDLPYMGHIQNVQHNVCIEAFKHDSEKVTLEPCNIATKFMYFKRIKQIKLVHNDEKCLTHKLNIDWCDYSENINKWIYEPSTKLISTFSPEENVTKCLTAIPNDEIQIFNLVLIDCVTDKTYSNTTTTNSHIRLSFQMWSWEHYKPTFVSEFK